MTWVKLYGWGWPVLTMLMLAVCLILGGYIAYLTHRDIKRAMQAIDDLDS